METQWARICCSWSCCWRCCMLLHLTSYLHWWWSDTRTFNPDLWTSHPQSTPNLVWCAIPYFCPRNYCGGQEVGDSTRDYTQPYPQPWIHTTVLHFYYPGNGNTSTMILLQHLCIYCSGVNYYQKCVRACVLLCNVNMTYPCPWLCIYNVPTGIWSVICVLLNIYCCISVFIGSLLLCSLDTCLVCVCVVCAGLGDLPKLCLSSNGWWLQQQVSARRWTNPKNL